MRILSLFDGMSCGRIALDRAGVSVKKYYASEIDKYAQTVSEKNYPDIVRLGDVTKWQGWEIEKPDIVIAGSPCQGFSFAGKQLNFNDPRSALFFTFVDILKHYKPKYFLLENVMMKKEYQDVISASVGVDSIEINSALVSAQNRRRLYWTNIPDVTQPKDTGIMLKDIIEDAETEKEKSYCIDANYAKGASFEQYRSKSRRQLVFGGAFRGRNKENPSDRSPGIKTEQRLEINTTGKQNTITSVSKDSIVCYGKNYVQYDENRTGNNSQEYRIFAKNGKSGTVIKSKCSIPKIKEDETITEIFWRKLTPIECERLQTVPDNYTAHVSNSQRYKMLGNGWTVDVIAHIFKGLK